MATRASTDICSYRLFCFSVDQEDDDFQCAGVLTSHSEDVKNIRWHPEKEVYPNFIRS